MVFSSATFLYIFLPSVFLLYTALPGQKIKNVFLLAASLVFYAFGEPSALPVMLGSIAVNYGAGRLMAYEKHKKTVLVICAAADILTLFVYKYAAYALSLITSVTGAANSDFSPTLPAGISFFTFQAMSYVIDCYRDKSLIKKSLADTALYISFFPQLIAGPIVRFGDINGQLASRTHTSLKTASGIKRFCFGLGKKIIVANTAAKAADYVFSVNAETLPSFAAAVGAVCYALQIYYDFSGYSDMAIGLGKMFGFEFGENFNYPYAAVTVTDFWRRWHISLSSWFRDYLYIPLGGSRKGKTRTVINKWIVFLCTGIWHGANLTFLVWGAMHGLALTVEGLTDKKGVKPRFAPVRRIITLAVVVLSFVIFRADSLSQGITYIGRIFSRGGDSSVNSGLWLIMTPFFIAVTAFGIVFSAPVTRIISDRAVKLNETAAEYVSYALASAVLALSLLTLSEGGYDPFIYFRF